MDKLFALINASTCTANVTIHCQGNRERYKATCSGFEGRKMFVSVMKIKPCAVSAGNDLHQCDEGQNV
ncbi:hypothetical protein [Oceanobacillus saliphilus]|uniref:hypothetical protein n=1 Tax=Oceanobacillus saliphilus TaxID=2925834 RepID=UPI00201DCF3A|nr:hypothetical protein [Oceanobacillus saliphilus]